MLNWVKKHRPKVVIQENVSGAPWVKIEATFAEIGYAAKSVRLDTKKYYIPHTRTRGCELNPPSASLTSGVRKSLTG